METMSPMRSTWVRVFVRSQPQQVPDAECDTRYGPSAKSNRRLILKMAEPTQTGSAIFHL